MRVRDQGEIQVQGQTVRVMFRVRVSTPTSKVGYIESEGMKRGSMTKRRKEMAIAKVNVHCGQAQRQGQRQENGDAKGQRQENGDAKGESPLRS